MALCSGCGMVSDFSAGAKLHICSGKRVEADINAGPVGLTPIGDASELPRLVDDYLACLQEAARLEREKAREAFKEAHRLMVAEEKQADGLSRRIIEILSARQMQSAGQE